MKTAVTLFGIIVLTVSSSFGSNNLKAKSKLYPEIIKYLQLAEKGFNKIPINRKIVLKKIALFVQNKLKTEKKVSLIYICTNNSRRSHMGQLWALAAAEYYGINGVSVYSGGLAVTAFNENAIKALNNAGFKITEKTKGTNPNYESRYATDAEPVTSFSKMYKDDPNPKFNFGAIMACSHADSNCPVVAGAAVKVSTPYEDPQKADGRPNQDQVYKERCKQIATEVLYTFSLVKQPNA